MTAYKTALGSARSLLWPVLPIVLAVLGLAYYLGRSPSQFYLGMIVVAGGALVLLREPRLGLLALIGVALVLPLELGTGTEVALNPATLLVPALLGIWLLASATRRQISLPASRVHRPLLLFLVAGLVSLLIGNVTWDPMIPRKDNFILVQLAQWAIFALSAGAFWLTALLAREELWLKRMTLVFLVVGGGMALLRVLPPVSPIFRSLTTGAVDRAPFWVLLVAIAGGQLLFNRNLAASGRLALALLSGVCTYYAFVLTRESASTWVGVAATGAVLFWLRFPRLRWLILTVLVLLTIAGILFPALYEFAGGDDEWTLSGGSRLALVRRVVDVTMRNPITGLGPASYRPYANATPFGYGRALWFDPQINSHNNYVDLFAHVGIVGLVLFFWFVAEVVWLGLRLRWRYPDGFAGGYVAGIMAAGAGSLAIMALADWILPFVYNIGFHGFQASVLVWLFMGGMVALDQMKGRP